LPPIRIVDCGGIATIGKIESLLEKDRLSINADTWADGIEKAGDILQVVLSFTAAGMTLV